MTRPTNNDAELQFALMKLVACALDVERLMPEGRSERLDRAIRALRDLRTELGWDDNELADEDDSQTQQSA
ncbi:hypothetical protein [Phreatobacter sp.]|uniref:hypothetical protein n=1 Tax=Phreatobacter sp. TaxID=1966341 RepID=UPI003F70BCF3